MTPGSRKSIDIDPALIAYRYVTSPGPGGQNVNKTATAVQLRFRAIDWPGIDEAGLARLRRLAGRRMTAGGTIVIEAHRFRSRERNREDANGRLLALLQQALQREKRRRPTRPTAASRERRLEGKRRESRGKSLRRTVVDG